MGKTKGDLQWYCGSTCSEGRNQKEEQAPDHFTPTSTYPTSKATHKEQIWLPEIITAV